MKNIFLITSAPIINAIHPYGLYDSYSLVSQDKLFAPLASKAKKLLFFKKKKILKERVSKIFSAEKGQTLETAKLLKTKGVKIFPTKALKNITFSMESCISKNTFMSLGTKEALKVARKQFVIQLFNNNLGESMDSVILRSKILINIMKKENKNSLFIGHSFFIKIFEIFLTDPKALLNQRKFVNRFNAANKPFNPLEGLKIEFINGSIRVFKYRL